MMLDNIVSKLQYIETKEYLMKIEILGMGCPKCQSLEKNAREAAVVNNLDVIGVRHINEAIGFLTGDLVIDPTVVDTRNEFFNNMERTMTYIGTPVF